MFNRPNPGLFKRQVTGTLTVRAVAELGCDFGIDPTILSQGSTEIQHFKATQAVFIPAFDGRLSFFTERARFSFFTLRAA